MWSRKHKRCVNCGTTKIRHVAKGLCRKCYTLHTEFEHKKHTRFKRGVAEEFLTKEKLIELYCNKGMSLSDIGKLAGCTRINVHYKLKRYGIEARSKTEARTMALDAGKIKTKRIDKLGNEEEIGFRKIRYNERFFKDWTYEMAYALGLIFTDGNIHIRKYKSGYKMGIMSFAQKDKELVDKFLKMMQCDAVIRYQDKRVYKETTAGKIYYFRIGNNDLINDLVNLGVTSKKSLDMVFPKVPSEYLRHFIRGLFDGDGSVFIDQGKYLRVVLQSGSFNFVKTLNHELHKIGFPLRRIYGGYNNQNSHYIRYCGEQVLDFFNYIYEDVPESLYYSRKHQVFLDYFKNLNFK